MNTDTFFAPAKRKSNTSVEEEHAFLASINNLTIILEALPFIVIVLNEERQLVHSNSMLLKMLGLPDIHTILSKRPGEIINCVHANEGPGGCGTSEHCTVCGAVQAVLESQATKMRASREARITTDVDGQIIAMDLLVVASPVLLSGRHFTVVSMADISPEKRKSHLERIFFHDIMNTSQIIEGYASLLKDSISSHESEIAQIICDATNHLVDEIKIQRELLSAESGELRVTLQQVYPHDMMHIVLTHFAESAANKGCYLDETDHCKKVIVTTDKTLLIRSLTNLVKNAIESSKEGETVHLNSWYEDEKVFFSVQNRSVMNDEVQLQIFSRSFSTKGSGRGWGTYSVKLLVEEYLQGKVSFISKEDIGTIFTIELPLVISLPQK